MSKGYVPQYRPGKQELSLKAYRDETGDWWIVAKVKHPGGTVSHMPCRLTDVDKIYQPFIQSLQTSEIFGRK